MKSRTNNNKEDPQTNLKSGYVWGEQPLKCDEIQAVLFAYMSHELGESQSVLVREHIRKCDSCRAEAAELKETLAMLNQSDVGHTRLRLSDDRRKRIMLAVFHPVINWIDMHHKSVSIALAILVLIGTIFALRNFEIFRNEPLDDGIPIWRYFKSGELPKLVEQHMKEEKEEKLKERKAERLNSDM